MKNQIMIFFAVFGMGIVFLSLAGCCGPRSEVSEEFKEGTENTEISVPASAEDIFPLSEGERAPNASLLGIKGESLELSDLYAEKPTVLIFYRGGWCPYCNTHLGEVAAAEPELNKLGYQILALSPDRPEKTQETLSQQKMNYQLLSDSTMEAAKAFGLAFRLDEKTLKMLSEYGIDIEEASGQSHHMLPVPAVYIVDTKGMIRFSHWNPDYKERLSKEDILRAAQSAKNK